MLRLETVMLSVTPLEWEVLVEAEEEEVEEEDWEGRREGG